ncbi:MAG: c-type cytochrome [Balneolales bacterium]
MAILIVIVGILIFFQLTWDRTFDVPLDEDFVVELTEESIDNGRYIVYGPGHCAYCHTSKDKWAALERGEFVPLSGGYTWTFPPGSITSPNLTPDPETGIGNYSDAELKRALRANVRKDGRAVFPMMDFHQMSEQDLHDVIAYLRSQPAVVNEVSGKKLNMLGKIVMAVAIGPVDWGVDAPVTSPTQEVSVERGAYLANNVAACVSCHTERNLMDGSYVGERFAGGLKMDSYADPSMVYVTPNLTPDPETGIMSGWSEEVFMARFEAGSVYPDSPMPWSAYQRMTETDLRAIYRYFETLDAVRNETGLTYAKK